VKKIVGLILSFCVIGVILGCTSASKKLTTGNLNVKIKKTNLGIGEKYLTRLLINESINNQTLFTKDNFKNYETIAGNRMTGAQSKDDSSLTAISYYVVNNEIETIIIWIPIVNQSKNENQLAANITDKILHKIFDMNFNLWDKDSVLFKDDVNYDEKVIKGKKIIFSSVMPDLIRIIITSNIELNAVSFEEEKYKIKDDE
jgi:hypothetical protein